MPVSTYGARIRKVAQDVQAIHPYITIDLASVDCFEQMSVCFRSHGICVVGVRDFIFLYGDVCRCLCFISLFFLFSLSLSVSLSLPLSFFQ